MYIVRFHSLYTYHRDDADRELMNDKDGGGCEGDHVHHLINTNARELTSGDLYHLSTYPI